MKVKELYKKYEKEYTIMLFGDKTLKYNSTPFTCLPKDKELDECEVVEMKIKDKEIEVIGLDTKLQYKGKQKYKGTIYALVK